MIPIEIYDYWVNHSGINDQTKNLDKKDIAMLEDKILKLQLLQSADDIRHMLASNDPKLNELCTWFILSSILKRNHNNPPDDTLLNLVEWALLISKYSKSKLLEANSTLLKGMLMHNLQMIADAKDAYRLSMEKCSALSSRKDLLGLCNLCLAQLYAELDDVEIAKKHYKQALDLAPNEVNCEKWHQMVLFYQQNFLRENNLLNQLLELPSSSHWISQLKQRQSSINFDYFTQMAMSRAFKQAVLEQHEKAIRSASFVDSVLTFQGKAAIFRRKLADFYLDHKAFPQAEILFRTLLEENKDELELKLKLAYSLQAQNKSDESKHILKEIIKSNPDYGPAHSVLGGIYVSEKQWDLAKKHLDLALDIDPSDSLASHFLKYIPKASVSFDSESRQMFIGGDINAIGPQELGEAMIVAMIASNPNKKKEILKIIAAEKGEDVARRIASKVSNYDANKQLTHHEKAEQLFRGKKFSEAIDEYKLAIAEDTKNWQAYMGLGDAYYMMGKFSLAAAYFEESVAIQPTAPTYYFLGDAYLRMGKLDKAIKAYQCSIDINPNYSLGKQGLQRALNIKKANQ